MKFVLTLSQASSGFYVSVVQVSCYEQFFFFPTVFFLPVWRTFCHFYQIWNCCLQTQFLFGSGSILSLGKDLRRVENILGNGENCWFTGFTSFPTMFSEGLFFMVTNCQDCVGKGWTWYGKELNIKIDESYSIFVTVRFFLAKWLPCPGGSVVSISNSWAGGCEFDPWLRQTVFQMYFCLSPLQKHVRKVVGGFGEKSCVSSGVRKPGNTCATPAALI